MSAEPSVDSLSFLKGEWACFNFRSRVVTTNMIERLDWEDFDNFVYQLFCREFKTLPEKIYDRAESPSYRFSFLPVLSHQEIVVRVVNLATTADLMKFRNEHERFIHKLYYIAKDQDDAFKKFGEDTHYLIKDWPQIEITQHHVLAKAAAAHNLDQWIAAKITEYDQRTHQRDE